MTCDHVTLPGGGSAIVCSTRRRALCACGRPAHLLCDWKMPERRSGTCDTPVCIHCTVSPVPGKDLCPDHAQAFAAWKIRRAGDWRRT